MKMIYFQTSYCLCIIGKITTVFEHLKFLTRNMYIWNFHFLTVKLNISSGILIGTQLHYYYWPYIYITYDNRNNFYKYFYIYISYFILFYSFLRCTYFYIWPSCSWIFRRRTLAPEMTEKMWKKCTMHTHIHGNYTRDFICVCVCVCVSR